jgi:hypothetical protein
VAEVKAHDADTPGVTGIRLDEHGIDQALPLVSEGRAKYLAIQELFRESGVPSGRSFQRPFNGFYRVRRGEEWQQAFFAILDQQRTRHDSFRIVLDQLHRATGRIETSFASKLVATVDPASPVIDSIVLKNVGLRLQTSGASSARMDKAAEVHAALSKMFAEYLSTPAGEYLISQFRKKHPEARITPIKMLDLVLWQTRPLRPSPSNR